MDDISRIGLVMAHIRRRIAAGGLQAGSRLPSIRRSAETLAVSKSTVVEAFARLAAQGEISARRGAGFFVAPSQPLSLAHAGRPVEREIDPLWVMRRSLAADDLKLKPGCGWLPESWMPDAGIRRALRAAARGA